MWTLKNIRADVNKLSEELSESKLLIKLLVNRGIKEVDKIREFLSSSTEYLNQALEMKDIEKAASLIIDKIKNKKRILVVGDFDADGVFSTYCLYTALLECGALVEYYIPHRVSEGYGISNGIVEKAHTEGYDTIITCDNGIAASEQVRLAKSLGLTFIITDHHDIPYRVDDSGQVEKVIPDADAIINPKQDECRYPFKSLCGAGVVFKFIEVLYSKTGISPKEAFKYLEFVAIATVCDVVDLIGENRIIVKKGLEIINRTNNIGLRALINATGLEGKEISAFHFGFVIGPCINATGRLETAYLSLELLLSTDAIEAEKLANKLVNLNSERKDITAKGVESVTQKIVEDNMINDKVLVVYDESIHESIAGIVAGRIREKYNSPTIILTQGHDIAKGSARSIENYNIFEELTKCKHLLAKFGGHPMAAGLSIKKEDIDCLRKMLNDNCILTAEDKIAKISIDIQLPLEYLNFAVIDEIKKLEPFGKGNIKPVFAEKGITVIKASILGQHKNMLKLRLKSEHGILIDGIEFEGVTKFEEFIKQHYINEELINFNNGSMFNNVKIDLIYSPTINEYRGNKSIQLQLIEYRKAL